eukprot:m.597798 g.597798  ORF g.597798 m.597798 type:complete len:535 (+) comp58071_c0_seq3:153-1757(+)
MSSPRVRQVRLKSSRHDIESETAARERTVHCAPILWCDSFFLLFALKPPRACSACSKRTRNCFANATDEPTTYEWIKIVLLGCTLAPIRVLLVVLIYLSAVAWCKLVLVGARVRDADGRAIPLSPLRRSLVQGWTAVCARVMLFVFGFYYIKVTGRPDYSAPIWVADHPSMFEPMLFSYFKMAHVGKEEVRSAFGFQAIVDAMQLLMVSRRDEQSCDQTKDALTERANSARGTWPGTMLYPEGTSTNGSALVTFKTGAFTPGVPVQPVAVRHRFKHYDCSWTSKRYLFWLRIFCQFINFVEVEFLETLVPTLEEKADASLFARRAQQQIATALGVPITNLSVADVLMEWECTLPEGHDAQTVGDLRNALKIPSSELRVHVEDYISVAHEARYMDLDRFSRALRFQSSAELAQTFRKFSKDFDGASGLSLAEYVQALFSLTESLKPSSATSRAFAFLVGSDQPEAVLVEDHIRLFVSRYEDERLEDVTRRIFHGIDKRRTGTPTLDDFCRFINMHKSPTSDSMRFKAQLAVRALA